MFSKSTEYALRATIYIAQKSSEEVKLGIKAISEATDSPASFTAKILQVLTRDNRIISSVRGPNGGFYMTKEAKQLPVRSILDAMEEDSVLERCILGLNKCSETKPCPMHSQYKHIKAKLVKLFETKTIEELASSIGEGEVFLNNN